MTTSTTPDDTWISTELLDIRAGTETITGAEKRPMLVTDDGRYIAISRSGLPILALVNGQLTGKQIIDRVSAKARREPAETAPFITEFLIDLRQANVLTIPPSKEDLTARVLAVGKWKPVKRFPLTRNAWKYAQPIARPFTRVPPRLLVGSMFAVLAVAISLIVFALTIQFTFTATALWPLVLVALGVSTLIHESSHAVALAYNRIRVKDAGVGLLFYVFPIAYVDRTDSYRLRRRWGRVLISLVGPMSDTFFAGLSALIFLTTPGPIGTFFHSLMLLQIFTVVANLNPLFPSDGYHAAEAAVGAINMRSRSLTYCVYSILRKPLPGYLRHVPAKTRSAYVAYVVVSGAYTVLMLALFAYQIVSIVVHVAELV